MNKSELIDALAARLAFLQGQEVDRAVRVLLATLTDSLEAGERIEIRGFGSFSLHQRKARLARNPKTGAAVPVAEVRVPHFRPGKELRKRVDSRSG